MLRKLGSDLSIMSELNEILLLKNAISKKVDDTQLTIDFEDEVPF